MSPRPGTRKGSSLLQHRCRNSQLRAKPAIASHADMHSGGTNIVLNPFNGHLETKGFSSPKALVALEGPQGSVWLAEHTLQHRPAWPRLAAAPAAITRAPGLNCSLKSTGPGWASLSLVRTVKAAGQGCGGLKRSGFCAAQD